MDPRSETFSYATGQGLNIGFLSMSYHPDVGGVQTLMTGLAREFQKLGHQVFVLCLDMSGRTAPFSFAEEVVEGVRVRRIAYAFQDHQRLADLLRHKKLEELVLAWLAETPCDVIHVHHLSGFGAGTLQTIFDVGQPLVLTLHDYWLIDPLGQMYATQPRLGAAPEPSAAAAVAATSVVAGATQAPGQAPEAPAPSELPDPLEDSEPFGFAIAAPDLDRWVGRIQGCWSHLLPSGGGAHTGPLDQPVDSDRAAVAAYLDYALSMLAVPACVLSPSEAAVRVFEQAGVPPGRIRVNQNGVDVEGLAEAVANLRSVRASNPAQDRALDGVESDPEPGSSAAAAHPPRLRLGVLGSVLPSKGALEFAIAFVRAGVPDVELEIHGNEPPYHGDTRYIERLHRLAELHPQVKVQGPYTLEQLPGILARLDGVVAPSRWEEVFGLTVREARAAGLPVLVSDAGALPGAAEGGNGGWVVPRDDQQAWIAAIREFANDDALRAQKASYQVLPRSLKTQAEELLLHYTEVIYKVTGRDLRARFAPQAATPEERVQPESRGEGTGRLGRLRRWLR